MIKRQQLHHVTIASCVSLCLIFSAYDLRAGSSDFEFYGWNEINPAANWEPRAGLEVLALHSNLYLMGGRTPIDPLVEPVFGASTIWGDVWKSQDLGQTWSQILDTSTPGHWAARA